jgi:hypothetical protein
MFSLEQYSTAAVFIFVHNKDQMFVPQREGLYGSQYYYFDASRSRAYTKTFLMKKTHQKYIDKERVIHQLIFLTIYKAFF